MGICQVRGAMRPGLEGSTPSSALVWMHGLGDTEDNWNKRLNSEVLPMLKSICGPVALVTPRAPQKPVTCNRGRVMTCWFDMEALPVGAGHQTPCFGCSFKDAKASASRIHGIIDKLRAQGIPAEKIAIGGFSQGAALAMFSSLQYPLRLACCVAFSGLLLGMERLPELIHPENQGMEVLWCHGYQDMTVLPSLQRVGCQALESAGVRVHKRRYKVGHTAHPQGIIDASDFLVERLTAEVESVDLPPEEYPLPGAAANGSDAGTPPWGGTMLSL
mmetsp:Transcript_11121/g.25314  ORF Transcript_11121/g.25314 Transcript_11121/m.25314 type:complete len:274 (-) Transcript_11121:95-916(-)